jgi:hypothetical protein
LEEGRRRDCPTGEKPPSHLIHPQDLMVGGEAGEGQGSRSCAPGTTAGETWGRWVPGTRPACSVVLPPAAPATVPGREQERADAGLQRAGRRGQQEALRPHSREALSAAGCAAGGEATGTALLPLDARSGNSHQRSAREQGDGDGLSICQAPERQGWGWTMATGRLTMVAQDPARTQGTEGTYTHWEVLVVSAAYVRSPRAGQATGPIPLATQNLPTPQMP